MGSIPIIDDYIGKTYSFIVSWVKSIEDEGKMPAIFVDFPTDEIHYPLKPTSVYGDAEIPVLIYVVGYAKPRYTIIRTRLTRNQLIPILTSIPWILILLILALCGFVIVLFLPSLWELRRPRDPGPRRIDEATIEKDD